MWVIGAKLKSTKIQLLLRPKKAADGCIVTRWRLPGKKIWTYDTRDKQYIESPCICLNEPFFFFLNCERVRICGTAKICRCKWQIWGSKNLRPRPKSKALKIQHEHFGMDSDLSRQALFLYLTGRPICRVENKQLHSLLSVPP